MECCDICGCEAQSVTLRRLYSAEREEDRKDAAWATSRVVLHFSDIQEHEIRVCAKCRREARRFYLVPFIPFLVTLVAWVIWLAVQPVLAPDADPKYVLLPGLIPLVLLLLAPGAVRRRYGMGEVQFGETPLRMFSLDNYLIYRLTLRNPTRVYWTPKWYRYFSERFQ